MSAVPGAQITRASSRTLIVPVLGFHGRTRLNAKGGFYVIVLKCAACQIRGDTAEGYCGEV